MNILIVDTTTKKANVAICINKQVYSKSIDNEITHSEKLLPLIDEVLQLAKLNLKDIDLYACNIGPGSFTGIRIGLATIKAFAKVYDKKIFTFDSLRLHCLNGVRNESEKFEYVVSMVDARNSRVYYTVYGVKYLDGKKLPEISSICPFDNLIIDEALESISEYINNSPALFVGDSATKFETNILEKFSGVKIYNTKLDLDDIALLINEIYGSEEFEKDLTSYLSLDANYIRSSEAQRTKYGENNG